MRLRALCAALLTCEVARGLAPHGVAPVRGRGLTQMGLGQAAEASAEDYAGHQLFVRNVPWKATATDLREAMSQYGVVTNAWLKPRPEAPSKHMGFGFVTFHASSSADAAQDQTTRIMGRDVICQPANQPGTGSSPRNRQFTNLKQARTQIEVANILEEIGELRTVKEHAMVISAWGRALAPDRAVETLQQMGGDGLEPNEFCFAAAISACAKAGEWERALAVYDDMGSRGLVADIVTFDALLAACDKGEQWERALSALNELLDLGLQPTKTSFCSAICACQRAGQWENALRLWHEMQARGLEPNMIGFSFLLSACDTGGRWEDALELLDQMMGKGLKVTTDSFGTTMSACVKGGQYESAISLWDEMATHDIKPDHRCYASAIAACENTDRDDRARVLQEEMREQNFSPST